MRKSFAIALAALVLALGVALTPHEAAAGGCGAAAAQAAAQYGGQVIGTKAVNQGGRQVCVVTLLIKDPTGSRPASRKTVTVAAN